jgi:hypothetical protein
MSVINNRYFKAQSAGTSDEWVRNPDWLPLPILSPSDNRFVGLFLVFENEYNQLTYQATGSPTIDFGDGTSATAINSVQTKVYDYATISSPVKQYYDGRNYKQVIVDIYGNISTVLYLDQNNGINNIGITHFVDVAWSLQNVTSTNFKLSETRKCRYLEQISAVYQKAGSAFPRLEQTKMLRSIIISSQVQNNVSISNNVFIFSGIDKIPFLKSVSTSINQMFDNSDIEEIELEALNVTGGGQSVFYFARRLRKVKLTLQNATNISFIFNGCLSLTQCEVYGLGNVTSAPSILSGFALSRLILSEFRLGFTVLNNNLTAQALNDLFTSLGTASGAQTIIITGNPGAATCDTSIATNKGWTITG